MFERFTETARRVIFFARYEASMFGSPYIESEHLLLGLMREDRDLRGRLGAPALESFRKQVEASSPVREKISTSVDLPLSQECRRVLSLGAEEAESLQQKFIGPRHLVLGLLRIDTCLAATFLKQNGIHLGNYREIAKNTEADMPERLQAQPAAPPEPPAPRPPKSASLAAPIAAINRLLDLDIAPLNSDQRLKRKPWSRKEAIGRLVDLATAHHHLLARALTEPSVAAGYPAEEWVRAQQYADYEWRELVSLWLLINRLLLHVLAAIPEEKLTTACRIGIEEPRTLLDAIRRYVAACEDLVGQIIAKLD